MTLRLLKRVGAGIAAAALMVSMAACSGDGEGKEASPESNNDGAAASAEGLKVGWSTIYLTPSWMQQTQRVLQDDVDRLKEEGVISEYKEFNADGNTTTQISHIQTMIQEDYDVILVVAGSADALNPILEQAVDAGIAVVNFDSLVTSDKVHLVGTDPVEWGRMLGHWLGEELNGEGEIIALNGPAGVGVSEDRWKGAEEALAEYPNIKIAANVNSEYNIAPAAQAFGAAYAANPDVDGVISLGGTLSAAALQTILQQNGPMIPITGENYNGFLKAWEKALPDGMTSLSVAQPNYMSVVALQAGVKLAAGEDVPMMIEIPLPEITNDNLDQWVEPDEGDDYYPIKMISQAEIEAMLE